MMVPHPLCPECHSEFVEKVQLSPQEEQAWRKNKQIIAPALRFQTGYAQQDFALHEQNVVSDPCLS